MDQREDDWNMAMRETNVLNVLKLDYADTDTDNVLLSPLVFTL